MPVSTRLTFARGGENGTACYIAPNVREQARRQLGGEKKITHRSTKTFVSAVNY